LIQRRQTAGAQIQRVRTTQKPAEQLMVIMKANTMQGRATAEIDFFYLQSSYLLEYMMTMNHALFKDFGFHFNARHLNR